jgi:hypothetical protein
MVEVPFDDIPGNSMKMFLAVMRVFFVTLENCRWEIRKCFTGVMRRIF